MAREKLEMDARTGLNPSTPQGEELTPEQQAERWQRFEELLANAPRLKRSPFRRRRRLRFRLPFTWDWEYD